MSREEGFAIADIDVGLYSDPKVIALARRLRDPVKTMAYVGLYHAAVLESWAAAQRVSIVDAAPAFWLEPLDEVQQLLEAVGLVDADGRPIETAWRSWFTPAWQRREKRRAAGREGGLASGRSRAEATAEQSPSNAQATPNPSVPSPPSESVRPSLLSESGHHARANAAGGRADNDEPLKKEQPTAGKAAAQEAGGFIAGPPPAKKNGLEHVGVIVRKVAEEIELPFGPGKGAP